MNYFINEYSLRGQFKDLDSFFESLIQYTLPVLKKVESNKENVIWKKDDLWKAEICNNITLMNIPKKKNERSSIRGMLIIKLIKLVSESPHWNEEDECSINVKEYKFDDEYKNNFSKTNCFIKGLHNEGRIISFLHESYKDNNLEIIVEDDRKLVQCFLDNIYTSDWWSIEPQIKTWCIEGKYKVEVRANEFDYHPPHFHVSYNEYAAVFTLRNGELYKQGKNAFTQKVLDSIYSWYENNKDELICAWNNLHGNKVIPSV